MTTTIAGRPLLAVPSTCRQLGRDFASPEATIVVDQPPMYAVHTTVGDRIVSHLQPVRGGH